MSGDEWKGARATHTHGEEPLEDARKVDGPRGQRERIDGLGAHAVEHAGQRVLAEVADAVEECAVLLDAQ